MSPICDTLHSAVSVAATNRYEASKQAPYMRPKTASILLGGLRKAGSDGEEGGVRVIKPCAPLSVTADNPATDRRDHHGPPPASPG